tara:strand:+ start:7050 stop:7688 length:639 start_codon:yes stop_codon:yes gene_type:complete
MPPTHTPRLEQLECIFAYRAFDLRDHFPQPLETFRQALECLQSDNAYLPDMSGEIVAYLRGGRALPIPEHFFIRHAGNSSAVIPMTENDQACEAVEAWLRDVLSRGTDDTVAASTLRPARLNILLDQCDPNAPEPDDIYAWQHMGELGREIINAPSREDIWEAAVQVMGQVQALRWMKTAHPQLGGKTPDLCIEGGPVLVYELVSQMSKGKS